MKTNKVLFLLLIIAAFIFNGVNAQNKPETELYKKIKALPGVMEIKATRYDTTFFKEGYEIMIEQPLDHSKPNGEKFQQRFFLLHKDFSRPVELETEGYSANRAGLNELTRILDGNEVLVEHRYFGRSVPKEMKWEYLTIKNAADDMHNIVMTLKQLYKGKWVSSGTSKGGQTTLFYKTFYPNDVDASVPYVAPINVAQEDPRIYLFLKNAGNAESRKKMREYQIALFKREAELLPLVKEFTEKRKMVFSVGFEVAYEYAVLEYEFAFWQYGAVKPADIPAPDAPAQQMIDHLNKTNAIYYYSDAGIKQFEPFIYQAFTEIGYYNYDITDLKPYMKAVQNPSNLILAPKGAKIVYNPDTLQKVYHFLQYEGSNIVYVYGELDTWSSTAVELIGRTNAIKLVNKGGYHGSRIRDLSPEQKELFYKNMESWLDMKLVRLPDTPPQPRRN
jgi:hypothetical protein